MSGIATAIVGSAVIGGIASDRAAGKAANAQMAAADTATAEQRRQYDLSRQDLAPYRQVGTQALNQLGSLYGFTPYSEPRPTQPTGYNFGNAGRTASDVLGPIAARVAGRTITGGPFGGFGDAVYNPNAPAQTSSAQPGMAQGNGMAGFWASPDYNFRRTEGLRGIEQSAAARGGALSGNALRATTNFSSDLASQEFGNYYNRLANLAGIGQTATNAGVIAGQNYANAAGQNAMAAGAARASGIMGSANSWGNALNTGLNTYMMYRGGWFSPPSGSGGSIGGFGK